MGWEGTASRILGSFSPSSTLLLPPVCRRSAPRQLYILKLCEHCKFCLLESRGTKRENFLLPPPPPTAAAAAAAAAARPAPAEQVAHLHTRALSQLRSYSISVLRKAQEGEVEDTQDGGYPCVTYTNRRKLRPTQPSKRKNHGTVSLC